MACGRSTRVVLGEEGPAVVSRLGGYLDGTPTPEKAWGIFADEAAVSPQ
jgi:hypothetical protein